jgi:glucose-6-phosphate 1-dehydrogenase
LKGVEESIVDSFLTQMLLHEWHVLWRRFGMGIAGFVHSRTRRFTSRTKAQSPLLYGHILPNVFGETGLAIRRTAWPTLAHGWSRLVIEKPFGKDLESCKTLMATLSSEFQEHHLYRIDHYLGKEVVQNLLIWRFANSMFENMWNRNAIQSVRIFISRSPLERDGRGGYFR